MDKFFLFIIIFSALFVPSAFSQDDGDYSVEGEEATAQLREQATEILRETSQMTAMLGSAENRITFSTKMAGVFRDLDEKESVRLFQLAMNEVRQYISRTNAEMNQLTASTEEDWGTNTAGADIRKRSNKMFSMISTLVSMLARSNPEWAYEFLQETRQIMTNPELSQRAERFHKNLEAQVIKKIAEQDITKSLELGRQKLSEGFSNDLLALFRSIYAKDPKIGAEFGREIIEKLKLTTSQTNSAWLVQRLFQIGAANFEAVAQKGSAGDNGPPMFSEESLRDLAGMIADQALSANTRRAANVSSTTLKYLDRFAPQKAKQIRTAAARQQNTVNAGGPAGGGSAASTTQNEFKAAAERLEKARADFQQGIRESVKELFNEDLTSEERAGIIRDVMDRIASVNNREFRFNQFVWLGAIAKQVGEQELAANILRDAEKLLDPLPQNRRDFNDKQNLARAYAGVLPDRAFSILEEMVLPLNDVIESYIKFTEFTGNRDITENGELLMNNYSSQFTRYFSLSGRAYRSLAAADFDRLKALADRFERPEVRIETRLQIAQNLLNASKQEELSDPD